MACSVNAMAFARSASVESALIAVSTRYRTPLALRRGRLGLGQGALGLARPDGCPIAVRERPAQPDGVHTGGACNKADQEGNDHHEGVTGSPAPDGA